MGESMKSFCKLAILSFMSLAFTTSANALPVGLDVRTGSLGIGAGASVVFNESFSMTASINGLQFSMSPSSKDLSMDGKMQLFTTGASLGWHPLKNSFRFLLGLFYDGNQFDLNTRLKQAVTIKGITVTPEETGTSKLKLHYNRVAPFLGVGFDAPFWTDCQWSMFGEAGFLFQGRAKAKFKRKNRPDISNDVAKYIERKAEHAGNKFLLNYYPVFTIGVKVAL